MPEAIQITINGEGVRVLAGTTLAAAMLQTNAACRVSISGSPRTAMCGMGICFECRAIVNGVAQMRTCQIICAEGMTVETQP